MLKFQNLPYFIQIPARKVNMFLEKKYDFATSFGGFISMFWPKKNKLLLLT
jgi:hypothetical protein